MKSSRHETPATHFGLCTACGFRTRPHVCRTTKALQQQCVKCKAVTPSPTACCSVRVLRRQSSTQMAQQLDVRVLPRDPTLARTLDVSCSECAGAEAVFFRPPNADDNEAMKLAFVCVGCGHAWVQ